jgi:hypothetical protein
LPSASPNATLVGTVKRAKTKIAAGRAEAELFKRLIDKYRQFDAVETFELLTGKKSAQTINQAPFEPH